MFNLVSKNQYVPTSSLPFHGNNLLLLMLKVEHVGGMGQFFVAAHYRFRWFDPSRCGRTLQRSFTVGRRSRSGYAVSRIFHILGGFHSALPSFNQRQTKRYHLRRKLIKSSSPRGGRNWFGREIRAQLVLSHHVIVSYQPATFQELAYDSH